MSYDLAIIIASFVTAIPATAAAILSYKGNARAKESVEVSHSNTGKIDETSNKLDGLANGVMDEKIRKAIRQVLDERSEDRERESRHYDIRERQARQQSPRRGYNQW